MKCSKCDGTGKAIKETNPRLRDNICPDCNGAGKIPDKVELKPETPERIYVDWDSDRKDGKAFSDRVYTDDVEYIRADLVIIDNSTPHKEND